MIYDGCYGSVGPPVCCSPGIGTEFDFLFISLLAQRNEPKKGRPGQGLRLSNGVSIRPYHSGCAQGRKCFAFISLHRSSVTVPGEYYYKAHRLKLSS